MDTPSKINLYLAVTGKRPDGYHELEMLFYPLMKPQDSILLDESSSGTLRILCDDPSVPADSGNLCHRAVVRYCDKAGMDVPPLEITIGKQIPVAAGMGGGSSDAGAVLRLLQQRFQALPDSMLAEVALSLGADVPYFLNPRIAVAHGVGEKLETLDGIPEKLPLLILAPGFPVSAAWAYRNLDYERIQKDQTQLCDLIEALRENNMRKTAKYLRNDLSHALIKKFPLLNLIEQRALDAGALRVLVSGSGPTLFALFENFEHADEANKMLSRTLDSFIRVIVP